MTRNLTRLLALASVMSIASYATERRPDQASVDISRTGLRWKTIFGESGSNPVTVDGALHIGSADGAVYSLDPATGNIRWHYQMGEGLSPATSDPQVITVPHGTSTADQMAAGMRAVETLATEGIRRTDMTPTVENGTVFIGSGDRWFYAIDAATGKKKWSYAAGSGMASSNFTSHPVPAAVLKNGIVHFVTEEGLHAVDALTGERRWLFETLQEIPIEQMNMRRKRIPMGPVMGDGVILLTAWPYIGDTQPRSFAYAVDPDSGKSRWVVSVEGLDITAPTTAKGLACFAVEERATVISRPDRVTLYALNASDGQVKWKYAAEKQSGTRPLLVVDNTVYFSTMTSLMAVQLDTGRQLWRFSVDEIRGNLQADDQHLFVVTHKVSMRQSKDTLHALAIATGQEIWSRGLDAHIAMVHEGVIYADGERLHAIDAATGKELWSFKGEGPISARLVSGGKVFLTTPTVSYVGMKRVDQGYLYAIDAKTGKL